MARSSRSLKVLHVLRAPVGGLFRHVVDLARGQVARGHQVGIIVDEVTTNDRAGATLSTLIPSLAFGLTRVPMGRHLAGMTSALGATSRDVSQTPTRISCMGTAPKGEPMHG
jgi:hypothetical protein